MDYFWLCLPSCGNCYCDHPFQRLPMRLVRFLYIQKPTAITMGRWSRCEVCGSRPCWHEIKGDGGRTQWDKYLEGEHCHCNTCRECEKKGDFVICEVDDTYGLCGDCCDGCEIHLKCEWRLNRFGDTIWIRGKPKTVKKRCNCEAEECQNCGKIVCETHADVCCNY